jgi:hypothetical protein
MKFEEIQPQPALEILDEVKMTTKVFDDFINSSEAEGMQAGFEAELCFRGVAETTYEEESEMDESEDRRARSINDIIEFFHDGDYNSRRDAEQLRETLQEEFYEWQSEQISEAWSEAEEEAVKEYIESNDWDEKQVMREYMEIEMELTDEAIEEAMSWYGDKSKSITSSKQMQELVRDDQSYANFKEASDHVDEMLDERVQESINNLDRQYDRAREQWEEDARDNYDDSDWLRDSNYEYMMDVYRNNDISWPYWTQPESSEGGYSEDSARRLASTMENALGVRVKVSSGYHSATRKPGLWIFEPDSSLEPDDEADMPVEIISPPMPLPKCLEILPEFFDWASQEDAYSNDSTGFHIGVSLPHQGGRVDYVKLALFLGDQYILDNFDRSANYFARSAMEKIRNDVKGGQIDATKVADTLNLMKSNLIELAAKTLKKDAGHGKYTSINMKGDYVEFRSMGSESYFSNPDSLAKALDTVKRYAYAMYIASRPDMYRDEYAKKLYKLLDKDGNNAAAMKEFADYVTSIGGADQQTVKNFMMTLKSDQYKDAPLPDRTTPARSGAKSSDQKYWWNVDYGNGQRIEVVASNKREALKVAAQESGLKNLDLVSHWKVTPLRPFKDSPGGVGNWSLRMNGIQVFRFAAADQGQANRMARAWIDARSPEFRQDHAGQEVEVVPLQP